MEFRRVSFAMAYFISSFSHNRCPVTSNRNLNGVFQSWLSLPFSKPVLVLKTVAKYCVALISGKNKGKGTSNKLVCYILLVLTCPCPDGAEKLPTLHECLFYAAAQFCEQMALCSSVRGRRYQINSITFICPGISSCICIALWRAAELRFTQN